MGYDHFALLGVAKDLTQEEYDLIEQSLKELREKHNKTEFGTVFGKVHHLCSGGFNEYWWDMFNESIKILYEKTKIETYYLYLCEYDGEFLTKYKYVKGEKVEENEVKINISDEDISCDWNINIFINYANKKQHRL